MGWIFDCQYHGMQESKHADPDVWMCPLCVEAKQKAKKEIIKALGVILSIIKCEEEHERKAGLGHTGVIVRAESGEDACRRALSCFFRDEDNPRIIK